MLVINQFRDYFNGKYHKETISICDLNAKLFDDYKTYRFKTKHNSAASVNKSLVPLFDGIKSLYENGLIEPRVYGSIYGKYESTKITVYNPVVEESNIRYLNPDQLNQFIEIYRNMKRQRTYEYMQMFLFAVNTGLRVSDVITLEWNHIDFAKRKLTKNMVKTKEIVEIYLNNTAIEILNIWKKWNRNKRFVFDLLREDVDFADQKYIHNTIASKNRTIQTSLRSIGEKMKLPFNLTFHVARHTFAVFALRQNPNVFAVIFCLFIKFLFQAFL
jgi:integrase